MSLNKLTFIVLFFAPIHVSAQEGNDQFDYSIPECSNITYLECMDTYIKELKISKIKADLIQSKAQVATKELEFKKAQTNLTEQDAKQLAALTKKEFLTNGIGAGKVRVSKADTYGLEFSQEEPSRNVEDDDLLLMTEDTVLSKEPLTPINPNTAPQIHISIIEGDGKGGLHALVRVAGTKSNQDWIKSGDYILGGKIMKITTTAIIVDFGGSLGEIEYAIGN